MRSGVTYVVIDANIDLELHPEFSVECGFASAAEAFQSGRPGLVYRFNVDAEGNWSSPKVIGATSGLRRTLH